MRIRTKKRRSRGRRLFPSLVAVFLMSVLAMANQWDSGNSPTPAGEEKTVDSTALGSDMRVHYLDVGQGSAALVESDGDFMLIDGGDRSSSSFVVSYLERLGITSLDIVLVSHYHADHLNGIIGALNAFDCGIIICPDYEADTKLYDSFLQIAEEKNIEMLHPAVGDSFTLGNASFSVISPISYGYSDENNNSIGIRLVNGSDSFLFTGDAEAESEEDFCALNTELSCDAYAAGHHGSATSTSWILLEKALPEYVVISCGKDNSYGHPHEETMEKLEAIGAKVFRTDEQGTIVAISSGEGIRWEQEAFHDYSSDYTHGQKDLP